MDKAAILAEVVRRNALRKEAKLPEIDMDFEFRFACAEAEWEAYERLCGQHAGAKARCHAEAVAAYCKRYGPDCDPGGFGGRIVVGRDADRRFTRYVRRVLGRNPPLPPVRQPVVYGGG